MGSFLAKCTLIVSLYVFLFISVIFANEPAIYHKDEDLIYLVLGVVFFKLVIPASIVLYVFGFLFERKSVVFFTKGRLRILGFSCLSLL